MNQFSRLSRNKTALSITSQERKMTTEKAIQIAVEKFSFKGYMTSGSKARGLYSNVANTVVRHLQPGSRILDFGSGPCDKTSVLQLLGFHCQKKEGWLPGKTLTQEELFRIFPNTRKWH